MTLRVRDGIAFRTALAMSSLALLAGLFSIVLLGSKAYERTNEEIRSRLGNLVDTVAMTTAAACFVEDQGLAGEVAAGLLSNSVVQGVVIRTDRGILAQRSRSGRIDSLEDLRRRGISRHIYSPFSTTTEIGEIIVDPSPGELLRLNRAELFFIGGALLLQMMAVIGASLFGAFRWIVQPIKGMSDELHRMSLDDHETLEIPPGHEQTEIGRLADDINALIGQLARARKDAEKASRAKGEFLATMSHEIRTPINAVVGLSHLALKTGLDPRQRDYIEKISQSGDHLLAMVNDVLDFAKIEAGKLELEQADFSLPALVRKLGAIAGTRASEKGLALVIDIAPDIPEHLNGDSVRLGQILLNYINNAVKFTASGSVTLRARLESCATGRCRIRFEVIDTGIGLRPDQMERLFQSFAQADASTTRQYGGTGLGLAICKQLAGLMHGEVGVDSVAGAGSTFWASVELGVGEAAPEAPPEAAGTVDCRGLRVLLAEDNPINQQIARELLEEAGLQVSVADNGADAVDLAARGIFDCVLMDVRMPEMDGIEATRRIRALPGLAALPIIAMTANAQQEDREQCLAAGMNDFIAKPIDPTQFLHLVAAWLKPAGTAPTAPLGTPKPSAASGGLIDHAMLARISRNDPQRLARLVGVFLQSTSDGIVQIGRALAAGDRDALVQLGHRYKSSTRSVGIQRLGDLMEALEHAAQAGDADRLQAVGAEISAVWQLVEREMAGLAGSSAPTETAAQGLAGNS
ncbi:MAG: response regulator [Dechloromonas sp.]|nr:response regulator [Dechloromonas sp.]